MAEKTEIRLLGTEEPADSIITIGKLMRFLSVTESCQRMDPKPVKFDHLQLPLSQERRNASTVFATPCVTSERHRQLWWEVEPYPPQRFNNTLRKHAYRKFWSMLASRWIWMLPEYVEKKTQALARDPRRSSLVHHKKEIMPECVVQMVRDWYPNPSGIPYMGHLWQ